jgi:hypothetical protein
MEKKKKVLFFSTYFRALETFFFENTFRDYSENSFMILENDTLENRRVEHSIHLCVSL